MGGSISAEHGLSQMKRAINAALDPKGIMSPEKVLKRNGEALALVRPSDIKWLKNLVK